MSSQEMTADILTKPLPLATHLYYIVQLGLYTSPRIEEECGNE
jgi:hypothetical protein